MITNRLILLFYFSFSIIACSQTDWVRWEKSNPTYLKSSEFEEREYDLSINSVSDILIKPLVNAYWFFISDVDGANCPFYPSCSAFFVQSVKQTNLVQGTLMFFDRFTRDTNVFGRVSHYPFYDKHHFYDPVTLYQLRSDSIRIIPANTYIKDE